MLPHALLVSSIVLPQVSISASYVQYATCFDSSHCVRKMLLRRIVLLVTLYRPFAEAMPDGTEIIIAAKDVLIGHAQLQKAHWPRKLMDAPTEEGQFEILIRKNAVLPIDAPHCSQPWLLVRMPAVQSRDAQFRLLVAKQKLLYRHYEEQVLAGEKVSLSVSSSGYGRRNSKGKLQLNGCNLWFSGR
jgi:hypothetical protein